MGGVPRKLRIETTVRDGFTLAVAIDPTQIR